MITSEKEIKLIVTGNDIKKLRDLLEMASIYMHEHVRAEFAGCGISLDDRRSLLNTLGELFGATA